MIATHSYNMLKRWRYSYWGGGLVILLLASASAYAALLLPLQSKIRAKETALHQLQKFAECAPAIQMRQQKLTEQHQQVEASYVAQHKRLPTLANEAAFLGWSSELAQSLGLELRDFRPAGSHKYGEYDGMAIRVNGEGSYAHICEYLQAISEGPRVARVVSVEITPLDAARERFQFSLQVIVFYQNAPAKLVKSETPHV